MDPGQISPVFRSLAVKGNLDPKELSEHSKRVGSAKDLLDSGKTIGQMMTKVEWRKIDTVMKYVCNTTIDLT